MIPYDKISVEGIIAMKLFSLRTFEFKQILPLVIVSNVIVIFFGGGRGRKGHCSKNVENHKMIVMDFQ